MQFDKENDVALEEEHGSDTKLFIREKFRGAIEYFGGRRTLLMIGFPVFAALVVAICAALYLHIYPVRPFCDSDHHLEHSSKCTICPLNALCKAGVLECNKGYVLSWRLLRFISHSTCVQTWDRWLWGVIEPWYPSISFVFVSSFFLAWNRFRRLRSERWVRRAKELAHAHVEIPLPLDAIMQTVLEEEFGEFGARRWFKQWVSVVDPA